MPEITPNSDRGRPDYLMLFSVALDSLAIASGGKWQYDEYCPNWLHPDVSNHIFFSKKTRSSKFPFCSKDSPCILERRGGHTDPALSILHGLPIATKRMQLDCQNSTVLNGGCKQILPNLKIAVFVQQRMNSKEALPSVFCNQPARHL